MFQFINFLLFKPSRNVATSNDSSKIALVNQMINSDKVVIFSKSYCTYCKLAKELFDKCNTKYTEYVLDNREDGEEIQRILGILTGVKTVPRIFVNQKCLGGRAECKQLYDTGELQKLLIY
ncbi:uncharacterized protein LOC130900558 [Diorhabda carinulata]|uniref:uncharacterized protein LOC130900558 n=1 Tax=Diorhabda carinulata TaxID=1163345 RepID=UPI0025A25A61|nr:uncharacterized protein LOC130900558 [Diorhabda carinulata]